MRGGINKPPGGMKRDVRRQPASNRNLGIGMTKGKAKPMNTHIKDSRPKSSKSINTNEIISDDSSLGFSRSSKGDILKDSNRGFARGPDRMDLDKGPSRNKSGFRKESTKRLADDSIDLNSSRKSLGSKSGRRSPDFGGEDTGRMETFGNRSSLNNRPIPSRAGRGGALGSEAGRDRRNDVGRKGVRRSNDRPHSGLNNPPRSTKARSRFEPKKFDSRRDFGSDRGSRASRGATSSYNDTRYEKHISSKLSQKRSRPLDFNKEKTKREKDWMLDFKSHSPVLYLPDRMEQNIKETISYLIKLTGVNNIPVDSIPKLKEKGVVPTLNYSCTLYDKKDREFIGRSYNSRPIQLKPNFIDTDPASKEFMFMHTSVKDMNLQLIIEAYLEIVELDNKNKTHYV